MVYKGKPYQKWMIWGYHDFWKHPYILCHLYFMFVRDHFGENGRTFWRWSRLNFCFEVTVGGFCMMDFGSFSSPKWEISPWREYFERNISDAFLESSVPCKKKAKTDIKHNPAGSRSNYWYDSHVTKVRSHDMFFRKAKPNPARRRKKMFVQSLEMPWKIDIDGTQSRWWWPPFPVISVISNGHFAGLTDFFGFIWASKNAGRWWNQSHMVSLGCCHYAIQMAKDHSLRGSCQRCGQFLAGHCAAVTLFHSHIDETASWGHSGLDQRTARFAWNRKHPSIDHVEVSSEKKEEQRRESCNWSDRFGDTEKRPLFNINPPSTCHLEGKRGKCM